MPTRDETWPPGTPCWIDLAVADVPAALEFYGAVLGWSFNTAATDHGGYVMCRRDGRAAAGIGPLKMDGQPTVWTTYLASDAVDDTARLIAEAGGKVFAEPFDVDSRGRACIATDQQGAAFGVWQSTGHVGVEVYGEPGSLVWNGLYVTDPLAEQAFYSEVFGYRFSPIEGESGSWTFATSGDALGSVTGLSTHPPGTPSHWVAFIAVKDTDAAVATAIARGGRIASPAKDSSSGRIVVIADPWGATLGLVGPAAKT
jgi:uncharacterized protein